MCVDMLPWFIGSQSVASNRMCSTDQGQVGEQVGDQGQVGEQSRQRWQEPWERNWECWQNSKPANNQQIITKVELYCQTPVPAMPCSTKRDLVKMHIMASHILFWWYEEGKSGRVQFIPLQKGQFCNITSMDCYPSWSISQNFPGNRGVQCSAEDIRWNR